MFHVSDEFGFPEVNFYYYWQLKIIGKVQEKERTIIIHFFHELYTKLMAKCICQQEWEILEACQPDGTSKPIYRRVILQKIIYKPSAEGVVESPVQYEEEEFEPDEATDAYDPRV